LSDANGVIDFGVVGPGDWEFQLSRWWDEGHSSWETRGNLNVLPGTKLVKAIVCPKAPPDLLPVSVGVDWPADLAGKDLRLVAQFHPTGISLEPPQRWMLHASGSDGGRIQQTRELVCGPGKTLSQILDGNSFYLWQITEGPQGRDYLPNQVYADLRKEGVVSGSNAGTLEPGGYRLARLIVLRPIPLEKPPINGERFGMVVLAAPEYREHTWVYYGTNPPDDSIFPRQNQGNSPFGSVEAANVALPRSFWREIEGRFEVRPGQTSQWTIPIPEDLARAVREKLKAQP
jgi:hypothetical protein